MKFLSRLFHSHIMTSSDIIMPRRCEATTVRFLLFRHQRKPLKALVSLRRPCPTFLGLQSHSFPQPAAVCHLLPLAFCLFHPSPCPSVISLLAFPSSVFSVFSSCCNFRVGIQEAREGDSFVFMPRQSFLQGWGGWSSQKPLVLRGGYRDKQWLQCTDCTRLI